MSHIRTETVNKRTCSQQHAHVLCAHTAASDNTTGAIYTLNGKSRPFEQMHTGPCRYTHNTRAAAEHHDMNTVPRMNNRLLPTGTGQLPPAGDPIQAHHQAGPCLVQDHQMAAIFRRVDLPQPDGPTIARNSDGRA